MCGIVGLFLKSPELEDDLGHLISAMLVEMTDRGPDSAGIAIYRNPVRNNCSKITVLSEDPDYHWEGLKRDLKQVFGSDTTIETRATHSVITANDVAEPVVGWLNRDHPELTVTSSGQTIEIYKERGLPKDVASMFDVYHMGGSHALGHTRMATESAVTTEGSHPFSTGLDVCLVHNGSLSNHNRLREVLRSKGIRFNTENDSEVAAGYLQWRLSEGHSLEQALNMALEDLDGFYTFAIGTKDGFAVLRDPIACKPAIVAETDDWVAMASEYRAIATLPGVEDARIAEPEPATVYSWQRGRRDA
jgi:glutamate synthase domain-containing protein 1